METILLVLSLVALVAALVAGRVNSANETEIDAVEELSKIIGHSTNDKLLAQLESIIAWKRFLLYADSLEDVIDDEATTA